MQQLPDHIAFLIWLDLQDGLSNEQQEELNAWLDENPYNRLILERSQNQLLLSKDLTRYRTFDPEIAWKKLDGKIVETSARDKSPIKKLWYLPTKWIAASLVLLLSFVVAIHFINRPIDNKLSTVNQRIVPGKNGALLTLSNGKKVLLDTIRNGIIQLENGSKANVINGQLSYMLSGNSNVVNNISTSVGRNYQMILADGTKVWLNSGSSISFPTLFNSAARTVKITGEAYFEVTKNKNKPFIVQTPNGFKIEVTGTKFNVSTYANEKVWKTTLVEGHVKVQLDRKSMPLMPGQQAQFEVEKNKLKLISNVDLEKTVAWKNGLFNFQGAALPEIMREIERWYDIKTEYRGAVPQIQFFGEISRNESLNDIMRALEESGVKLTLDKERRLIIIEK